MSMKPTSIRNMNSRAAAELLPGRGLSMGALPRDVACEQGGNRALGLGQLLPAALQERLKAGQLRLQIRAERLWQPVVVIIPDRYQLCQRGDATHMIAMPMRYYAMIDLCQARNLERDVRDSLGIAIAWEARVNK